MLASINAYRNVTTVGEKEKGIRQYRSKVANRNLIIVGKKLGVFERHLIVGGKDLSLVKVCLMIGGKRSLFLLDKTLRFARLSCFYGDL